MAKEVQRRRGTEAENDAFTGADGEITVDTTNNDLRVHDGETEGGHLAGQRAVDARVPDPSGEPDGRGLEVFGGALRYGGLGDALIARDPRLWPIYETGVRGVSSPANAIGQLSDSGHEWEGVSRDGRDLVLEYQPPSSDWPLRGTSSPTVGSNGDLSETPAALLPGPGTVYRSVRATMAHVAASNWIRFLIVNWIDDDNVLAIRIQQVALSVVVLNGGVETVLATNIMGGAGSGGAAGNSIVEIGAETRPAIPAFSAGEVSVAVTLNGESSGKIALREEDAKFGEQAGRVGLAFPTSTGIWSFHARRGLS